MAQINITLNQDEILQLLTSDRDETFKRLLQESLNAILRAESSEQIGAEPYERNSDRTDSRNGILGEGCVLNLLQALLNGGGNVGYYNLASTVFTYNSGKLSRVQTVNRRYSVIL